MSTKRILGKILGGDAGESVSKAHQWLFAGFWVNTVAQFMYSSIIAVYLHRKGLSPSVIGIFMLVFHLCMRCTGPVSGALIEAFGTRFTLLLGTALSAAGYLATAYAALPWQYAVSMGILGFGLGLDHVSRSSLLVQVSSSRDEGNRALATYYVVFNFGAAIGPLVSSAATFAGWSPRVVLTVVAAIALTTGLAFATSFPFPKTAAAMARRPRFRGLGEAWADRRFRNLVVTLPLVWFLFSLMHVIVPVLLMERAGTPEGAVTAMFTLNAVLVVLCGYRVNRWTVRYCERRGRSKLDGVAIGTALMGAALFVLLAAPWLPSATTFLFMALFTLGELCFVPMVQILVNESIGPERTPGPFFGLSSLAWGIGGAMSNLVGGSVVELTKSVGFSWFPLAFGFVALASAAIYWSLSTSRGAELAAPTPAPNQGAVNSTLPTVRRAANSV